MAQIHFRIETNLAPAAVLAVLTDFGPRRAKVWPNIDDQHFRVHDQGPGWADVTEGSSIAGGVWEREKYAWDAAKGHVSVETVDSNTWGPGSRWDYDLTPTADGGTQIEATIKRRGKGWKGRLIELGLAVAGASVLRSQMEQALARSAD
jgi:polyketide cyclase/dehydrase/lipid transport protein